MIRLAVLACMLVSVPVSAAVVLTTPVYTQDFDTLASSPNNGTGTTLPPGWSLAELGVNANSSYGIGNGSLNTGNTYSFGATGSTERALGGLASANLQPRFGVEFNNGLGAVITSLDISFFGELWRIGTPANTNTLSFAYSLTASSLADTSFTGFSALDYTVTPGGSSDFTAVDGNANRSFVSASISGLEIMPGASFFLRWAAVDAPGFDHGMAIDDFQLRANVASAVVPEPETWAMLIAGFGLVGGLQRRQRRRGQHVPC
jgi:hypothetical protein